MDELLYEVRVNIKGLNDKIATRVRDEAVKRLDALADGMERMGAECRWTPFTED